MSQTIDISSETLRELQLKELDSLNFFKEFCEKNNLKWYLLGGCVIGAIRHKGFIPWDDDIDIIMPRDSYDKMIELMNGKLFNNRYLLLKTDGKEIFTGNSFATLIDTSATLVKENQENIDIPHGIVTDIFPLDGCPNHKIQRCIQYFHTLIYSLFITEYVPTNHGKVVSFFSDKLLKLFKSKEKRTKIWQKAEKRMTKYDFYSHKKCTELCAGPHYMLNEYPYRAFRDSVLKEFEGTLYPVPVGYHRYLRMAFGNYMEMPKEEDQVPHHDLVKLDLNTPCLEGDQDKFIKQNL